MLHIDARTRKALQNAFSAHVRDMAFPCVGAKAALAKGRLKVVVAHAITSAWDDVRLHEELMAWAWRYAAQPALFQSFAVVFSEADTPDERTFERHMWARLQSIAEKDAWRAQSYDMRVRADPSDPHFALSIGGEAFFVVGLHPHASRPARRFMRPALVFNLHDQFETLRRDNLYEPLRAKILARDEALAGSPNPMLARHGETSEARQYSGRAVEPGWTCPFHDPRLKPA